MQPKKQSKNNISSVLSKVAIGAIGVIGGLLIGKAIDEATKKQEKPANLKIKVDPTQYTKNIEDYDNVQQLMTCPITNCLMQNPVIITQCGHTFQKVPIQKWVDKNKHCPLCNVKTNSSSLKTNYQLQQVIAEYLRNKKQQREAAQEKKEQVLQQNNQNKKQQEVKPQAGGNSENK